MSDLISTLLQMNAQRLSPVDIVIFTDDATIEIPADGSAPVVVNTGDAGPDAGSDPFAGADIIHCYTRAQAIEDGVLVDLSALCPDVCRQFFKYPIACTGAVFEIIEEAMADDMGDLNGIVHDVLFMAYHAARMQSGDTIYFKALVVADVSSLKAVVGPNDDMTPAITLMFRNED